jgi:hypothetical protein
VQWRLTGTFHDNVHFAQPLGVAVIDGVVDAPEGIGFGAVPCPLRIGVQVSVRAGATDKNPQGFGGGVIRSHDAAFLRADENQAIPAVSPGLSEFIG